MKTCNHKTPGPVSYSPTGVEDATCGCGKRHFEFVSATQKQLLTELMQSILETGYHIQEKDGIYTLSLKVPEETLAILGHAVREDLYLEEI